MAIEIHCPACGKTYRLDGRYAGRRVRCAHCERAIAVPAGPVAEDVFPEVGQRNKSLELETIREEAPPKMVEMEDIAVGRSSFMSDVLRLALPFRSLGDMVTFVLFTLLAFGLFYPLSFGGCFITIAKLVLLGLVGSFLFRVTVETASGNDHLPMLFENSDSQEQIFQGLLFMLSSLYALIPALAAAMIYRAATGPDDPAAKESPIHTVLWALLVLGIFLWPMVVSIITWEHYGLLRRPDLIVRAIIKVLPAYLVCFLILLLAGAVWQSIAMLAAGRNGKTTTSGFDWLTQLVLPLAGVAALLWAVRAIGLLTRHYHEKLPC